MLLLLLSIYTINTIQFLKDRVIPKKAIFDQFSFFSNFSNFFSYCLENKKKTLFKIEAMEIKEKHQRTIANIRLKCASDTAQQV